MAVETVLRSAARPLTREEIDSGRIRELIEHMRETLSDAPGVGLAAPQIEMDHLRGTLYVDRMCSRSFCTLDNYNRHWKSKPADELAKELCVE